ncbi:MAG: AmmeMemoRadiSam system protein B, partial [Bacteroidetes bacterium]
MIIVSLFSGGCNSQDPVESPVNRKAYAAGKFYAGNSASLEADLQQLFEKAKEKEYDHVQAIIVPHAGYPYSGLVAASGYNQIDPD